VENQRSTPLKDRDQVIRLFEGTFFEYHEEVDRKTRNSPRLSWPRSVLPKPRHGGGEDSYRVWREPFPHGQCVAFSPDFQFVNLLKCGGEPNVGGIDGQGWSTKIARHPVRIKLLSCIGQRTHDCKETRINRVGSTTKVLNRNPQSFQRFDSALGTAVVVISQVFVDSFVDGQDFLVLDIRRGPDKKVYGYSVAARSRPRLLLRQKGWTSSKVN